jgi:hypothetical protein
MRTITNFGLVLLIAALPASAAASQQTNQRTHENAWTGTVTAVNTKNQTLSGGHWWYTRTFNVGEHCTISTLDKKQAALSDLRPGDEVRIRYQEAGGVLVADRVAEKPLHYTGTVHAVNEKTCLITMTEPALYKPFRSPQTFRVASDCKILLPNGKSGQLADLKPGDRIRVIYELPGGSPVAYRIRDKSLTFVGTVDAVNLSHRTIEAKGTAGQEKFRVAEDCHIMVNGKRNEELKDVALDHPYQFTYEQVDGINVVERITPVPATSPSETASAK